jgi:hypothetical protein
MNKGTKNRAAAIARLKEIHCSRTATPREDITGLVWSK